jgi:DNA-directed RNA polymerase subunit RPC12/RpoP
MDLLFESYLKMDKIKKTSGEDFLKKCGGCGNNNVTKRDLIQDKNNNRGYLCKSCKTNYKHLLQPDSTKRFWMCGNCSFRILASTKVDSKVDINSKCPNCNADVNKSLVNLSEDKPVNSDIFGHPIV